jgi:hemerythrin-like domain-containing protein
MPVQIGDKSHNFTDPTGLLTDCHRRIEMFMSSLQAVAEAIDRPPSDEVRAALENALRYFAQAAPKHTADEESSLFPRMRRLDDAQVRSALSELDRLEGDHRVAEPLHGEVQRIGEHYLATGSLSDAEIQLFRKGVATLASMYKQHIELEDSVIFPVAARVLSEHDKALIAAEMAERRKAKLVNF